jgi:hypothetical protein
MLRGSSHWAGWARRKLWTPEEFGSSLISWWNTRLSTLTLGGTPLASGAAPPVVTYTGTLTGPVVPYLQIDGAGARGVATFKVSYDDGATFPHTGILTAASVALPGVGSAITANFATGTDYATDNVYQSVCESLTDLSASANHASQGTAAQRPLVRANSGRRILRSDGVNDSLRLAQNVSITVGSIVFVGNKISGTSYRTGVSLARMFLATSLSAGEWGGYADADIVSGATLDATPKHLTQVVRAANDIDLYTNAASKVTRTNGTGFPSRGASDLLGQGVSTQITNSDFYEALIFDRALTEAEVIQLYNWARYDSGIS